MGNNIGSVLGALLTGASQGFSQAKEEDKLKQDQEKLDIKNRRFSLAKLIFDDPNATEEAKQLSLQVLGGQNTGKIASQFDQFVALGSMQVDTPGGDAGSALPRGRPVELQGPPDQLNQEGNINPDAQAGITEGAQGLQPRTTSIANPDGSRSSERSITIEVAEINGGAPTNIPTIFDGQQVSEEEAIQRIIQSGGVDPETGRPLPAFSSNEEAVQAAGQRSDALGQRDFQELEQPPTGPTQEALDRRVIKEPGTKNVGIFTTEIERIEERFAATEKVKDLNTQAALRDASVFLQGLPPEIPLEDKQSFFSMVRQGGDVIAVAQALNFPMTVAQKKAFKDQALNSTRNEATTAFIANPSMSKADFVDRYSSVLGREESEAMHTQLNQAEEQRERNVEEQEAKIAKLKADAAAVQRLQDEGKPLTEANRISLKKDTTALRVKYNKLAGQLADSNGAETVFLFGSTPPWAPRDKVIETLQAFAVNIRSNENRLGVAQTQFGQELPDFETEEVGGAAAQQQGIEKAAGKMNLTQLGDALADAGAAMSAAGLSREQKAQIRSVQRTIQVEIQRRQEGLN